MNTLTSTTRRFALLLIVSATFVALAACGTDDNSAAGPSATGTASTTGNVAPVASQSSAAAAASQQQAGTTDDDTLSFESAGFSCATGTLRSSGSTAQGKVMAEMITSYNAKCDASINDYGGGGSGQGITDFISGQTDFGGSDSAMDASERSEASERQCDGGDAIDLPMVTGPIAVAYRLGGIGTLVLTPDVLSGIFAGTITTWSDPAIAEINPSVTLPDLAITSIHRSEDSGTTDNFTRYLAAAGTWTFPEGKAWSAPGGTGAQGSDGVANAIASTEGSIGYVEWGYAQQGGLDMAQIDNGAGPVKLTAESAGIAVQAATVTGIGKDLTLEIDYTTTKPGAYPIVLVTYELVCTSGNGAHADLLRSFLGYVATDGQQSFVDLGAAPLPESIQRRVVDAITALR